MALQVSYDQSFVTLSFVIGAAASYVSLEFANRLAVSHGRARFEWGAVGAVIMGLGIWSMHFTGMQACHVSLPLDYDVATTAVSLLFAILASGLALGVASLPRMSVAHWLGAGSLMAMAICAMHYLGMAALRMQAVVLYNPYIVGASITIAFVTSLAALAIAHHLRSEDVSRWSWRKVIAATVMSTAICGMHYTAMAAATFVAMTCQAPTLPVIAGSSLGNGSLGMGFLFMAFVAILAVHKDHLQGEQIALRLAKERIVAMVAATPDAVIGLDLTGHIETWNPGAERLAEQIFSTLVGRPAELLWADPAAAREVLARVLAGETLIHVEASWQAGAGESKEVALTLSPLRGSAGEMTGAIMTARDVTARRFAELERFRHELAIATRIQTGLLPRQLEVDGFELALDVVAAAEVGGDLVDYLPQPDGSFWLATGDVTGHGLLPGLVMMMAQSILSGLVLAEPQSSPVKLLANVNRALYKNVRTRLQDDNFMTLQLLRHEGDGRFVAAGMHCDIMIHRASSGAVERINVPGTWVGLMPEIEDLLEEVRFALEPGDTLLLFTDGVIEAMNANKEQYDVERLALALARMAELGPTALKDALIADVQAWLDVQTDDLSLVVLRRSPVPQPMVVGPSLALAAGA